MPSRNNDPAAKESLTMVEQQGRAYMFLYFNSMIWQLAFSILGPTIPNHGYDGKQIHQLEPGDALIDLSPRNAFQDEQDIRSIPRKPNQHNVYVF